MINPLQFYLLSFIKSNVLYLQTVGLLLNRFSNTFEGETKQTYLPGKKKGKNSHCLPL